MKKSAFLFLGYGFELTGLILGGLFIGAKIDEIYGFRGAGQAGGCFIGLAVWCFHLYKATVNMDHGE